jgi:hypothetical protein
VLKAVDQTVQSDAPLQLLLRTLEALHDPEPAATGADPQAARLALAAQLLRQLAILTPAMAARTSVAACDDTEAAAMRVMLDVYERALRELRALARDARGRIERAEAAVADGGLEAKRCRKALERTASRTASWR